MEKLDMKPTLKLLLALLLAASGALTPHAFADESNVLDFEGDVIEGEKRKPDLFLQMESSMGTLDAVIYSREDFNDYHELDRKWRPRPRKGIRK